MAEFRHPLSFGVVIAQHQYTWPRARFPMEAGRGAGVRFDLAFRPFHGALCRSRRPLPGDLHAARRTGERDQPGEDRRAGLRQYPSPSLGAGQRDRHRRSCQQRPRDPRHRRRVERARAPRLRDSVPVRGRPGGDAGRSAADHANRSSPSAAPRSTARITNWRTRPSRPSRSRKNCRC